MAGIHFITQGCSANTADTEIMQGLLQDAGHQIVPDERHADIIVFNSCTVKGPTECFFRKKLAELSGRKVVLAGCIPQAQTTLGDLAKYPIIGTYDIEKITMVVDAALEGRIIHALSRERGRRLNLPKVRKNPLIEIVPIAQGCLGHCTYCKTKIARGGITSYRPTDIITQVGRAIEEGAKEIWITSQDNGAYGKDIGITLSHLLSRILETPGEYHVRLGMANPDHVLTELDELITLFKHPRMFKFLHIPVQSGSNKVLRDMERPYTAEAYLTIVEKFRAAIPDISIATDIICGYPTETEKDFHETLAVMEQSKPDIVNISRFWPRPGTAAANIRPLHGEEVKRRGQEATMLFKRIALLNNKRWIGWKGDILITEHGKFGTSIGKNYAYRQVILKGDIPFGIVKAEITDASAFDLRGRVC